MIKMPMWSLPLKNMCTFPTSSLPLKKPAHWSQSLRRSLPLRCIAAAQTHRSRSKKRKNKKTKKKTKNTQMVVNVKEFANAGSVKRRAPVHCGKSFHVTAVAQKKRIFFEKTKTRLRGKKKTEKKQNQKNIEQLTSIGRKLSNWRRLGENWATDVGWEKIVYWLCPSRRQDKEQANTTLNWKPLDKIRMVYMEDHCSRSAPSQPLSTIQPLSMLPALYRVHLQPSCTITCLGNKKYNTAGNPHTTARSSIIIGLKLFKLCHYCIFN